MLLNLLNPSQDPASLAAVSIPGSIVCAAWFTYNVITFDDRDHAELLIAAIGGPGRARFDRAAGALAVMVVGSLIVGALQLTDSLAAAAWMASCLVAGAWWGVSMAALLAPPMIAREASARLSLFGLSLVSVAIGARSGLFRNISAGELRSFPQVLGCLMCLSAFTWICVRTLLPRRALCYSDAGAQ